MAKNPTNPLERLTYIPVFRRDALPFSVPLYNFFFRDWGYNLLLIWLWMGGVISSLNYLVLAPMGLYVLKVGLTSDYSPYFPYVFWLGGFVIFWVVLFDTGDSPTPMQREFHEQHLVRKISLFLSGVGGIVWSLLWMNKAYADHYSLEDVLGFVYRIMESPWYTLSFLALSAARLLAVYAWVGAVSYRTAAVAANGEPGGIEERGLEIRVVREAKRENREADKDPQPGEKEAIIHALRKEVVLPPQAEEEVAEVILSLKHYKAFKRRFGANPPRGILLVGPPGTGKTSVARFIAKHAGLAFLAPTPGELRSKWLGESAFRIASLFKEARRVAPSILFIDELDAVAPKRGGHEEVDHSVGQLLQELDGISTLDEDAPVILVGASNHQESIDPAVLSRIGAVLTIPLPGPEERRRILTILLKELSELVDLDQLVRATEGFSGRDLQTVVTRAQRKAFTSGKPNPSTEDLLAEVRVVEGGKKKGDSSGGYDPRLFKRLLDDRDNPRRG